MHSRFRTTLLGCSLTIASLSLIIAPAARAQGGLVGDWEGFLDAPRRPVLMTVHFKQVEGDWEATADIPGANGIPLEDVRFETPQVRFTLPVADPPFIFEGKLDGDSLSGSARQGEGSAPFSLGREVAPPPPADRVEAWQQDLSVVEKKILAYDRSFSPLAREASRRALAELRATLAQTSDPEIIVALSRAVALSGNAHTRLYLLRNRTELRRLPIRVYWFAEGLYVVKARRDFADTLGARVVAIGGHDPHIVRDRTAALFAGNESWVDYKSTYFMTSPEILFGLGLVPDMEKVQFTFERGDRKRFTRALVPMPLKRKDQPTEAWRDLSPFSEDDEPGWLHVLAESAEQAPLYLRHPELHYWFAAVRDSGALYFQYNRSQNMPGESLKSFGQRMLAMLADEDFNRMIVDLRFNTGGNLEIAEDLMEKIIRHEKLAGTNSLYFITGRSTFSAGLFHAAQFRQAGRGVLVGEPVGDALDYWAEGGNLVLPNSKLTVHFANGYHNYSKNNSPEPSTYFRNLDINDLIPQMPVPLTWKDYVAGNDAVLAAILAVE